MESTKHIFFRKIPCSNDSLTFCRETVPTPNDIDIVLFPEGSDCPFCVNEYELQQREWRLIDGTSTIDDRKHLMVSMLKRIAPDYVNRPLRGSAMMAMEVRFNIMRQLLESENGYKLPKLRIIKDPNKPNGVVVVWEDEL